jgi:hypothetical protein
MTSAEDPAPAPDDADTAGVKDRFRDALERKRIRQAEQHAGQRNDQSKIHGEHGAAGVKRTFRRKSG